MDSFICVKCNMTFRSMHFLVKHKEKFCIGAVSQSTLSQVQLCTNLKISIQSQKIREKIKRHKKHRRFPESVQSIQTSQRQPEPNNKPVRTTQTLPQIFYKPCFIMHFSAILEKIDYKLQELAAQNGKVEELERMLFELKEREQRNAVLLKTLMDHLQQNGQDVHQSNDSTGHFPHPEESVIEKYVPVYSCGVLSTEISALRLSYLQNGGRDPHILAHLEHLLDAAIKLETGKMFLPKLKRPKDDRRYLSRELVSTELENQCLEEEIMKLELRKRRSRTTFNFRPVEQEMRAATMDIDLLKHEIEINRLQKQTMSRKQVPSIMAFPPQEELRSSPVTKHLMIESDGLHLRPYDPKTGFVVFYDFLLGLCPSYRVCRLVVGMYSRDVCLGSTSILPPVYCNPFSPFQHNQEQNAIFASKQAVPDVQPASSISLVIQVQASGGYDVYSQEVTHLAPRGWMKLCIFDHHNHLISGRWKVPVRLLPAKPSMITAEVNAVPQV
ncbi:coiled-coil domain-containing protein 17 isoform X3, partial [Silurus meridionalis]